tara:strand:- start:46 stop:285 length:240 start_codon:yes stop_codon:yes gene_type:complete
MTLKRNVDGVEIELSSEEEAKLRATWAEEEAKMAAVRYQNDRRNEYPSYADQLDQIYHEGIDAWKATIKTVKDKYPKPS